MCAYCTADDIRLITNLSSSEISDANITSLISHATLQLNADIQIKWENERALYLNSEKQNTIDGSNRMFYLQHYPLGDRDDNGTINGNDIFCYALNTSTGVRRQIVVSGIIVDGIVKASVLGGPLWLSGASSAPETTESMYFTYFSSPVDMETPHPLVKLACMQLTAALCFTRIDAKKVQSFRVGKIAVMRQSDAFRIYRSQYYDTINRIRQEILKVTTGSNVI